MSHFYSVRITILLARRRRRTAPYSHPKNRVGIIYDFDCCLVYCSSSSFIACSLQRLVETINNWFWTKCRRITFALGIKHSYIHIWLSAFRNIYIYLFAIIPILCSTTLHYGSVLLLYYILVHTGQKLAESRPINNKRIAIVLILQPNVQKLL